jgi:hypothetical protein
MQSFELRVFTATIMLPQEILGVALLASIVFAIFSAEADLFLAQIY